MEELPQMKFSTLKMVVSKWFDENRSLTMLKVLFRDHVEPGIMAKITNTMDLMNDLVKSSNMSPRDLTILYDTIILTKHYALQERIKKAIPSFPDVRGRTVSRFKPQRQRLVKFGMVLTPADVTQIDGLYNFPVKNYTDGWSMITDLETRTIISETNMKEFNASLETTLNLPLALNALREDIPGPSSTLGAFSTSSVLVSTRPKHADIPHTQEASRIKELSSLEFNQLLGNVSSWWEHYGNVNMLKVILSEFKVIPVALIEEENKPRSLFQLLKGSGLISPSNVDVIIETVVLGGQSGVEQKIKESIPTFPGISQVVITRFSKYRRNLLEFGKVIGSSNKERIGYLFNLHVPELKDQWCLIFKLERDRILNDDLHVKQAFVNRLIDNGMIAEAQALNTY